MGIAMTTDKRFKKNITSQMFHVKHFAITIKLCYNRF